MMSPAARLGALSALRPETRSRALIDALRYAEPDEVPALAGALLAHAPPSIEGYSTLLMQYYQMDAATRARILQSGPDSSEALSRAARSDDASLRSLALQLIERREDTRCLAALAGQFEDPKACGKDVEIAARTLLAITRNRADALRQRLIEPALLQALDRAIARAVDTYPKHRRPEALLSAAILSNQAGPALRALLDDESHPAQMALRGVLKHFDDDSIARSALEWLQLGRLGMQLQDRIAILAQTPHLRTMLSQVHLVHLPAVRNRLKRLNARYPASVSSRIAIEEFDPTEQQALAAWLTAIPMREPDRVARLGDGLCFAAPEARLAMLRGLMSMADEAADAAVESFCFDEHEAIARQAWLHLRRRRSARDLQPLGRRLLHSPHAAVRHLAARHLEIDDFETWWALWPMVSRPDPDDLPAEHDEGREREDRVPAASPGAEHRLAARRMLREDGRAFRDALRRKVTAEDRSTRLKAIAAARELDLVAAVELELLTVAADDDDARVTSAVMTALGALGTKASREALLVGVRHADARVRANALEALDRRSDVEPDLWRHLLAEKAISNENRLRANAVRALRAVDPPEAGRHLGAMLADHRPMHRISGLWVAERLGAIECAREVATIARGDEHEPVRTRARRTAARLLGRMQAERFRFAQPDAIQVPAEYSNEESEAERADEEPWNAQPDGEHDPSPRRRPSRDPYDDALTAVG